MSHRAVKHTSNAGRTTPIVLIPGLLCTRALYEPQIPHLQKLGDVHIAENTAFTSMPALAEAILTAAPPRFALCGLSMGGYIALEIMRQAPERVSRLALLDTSARPETPEQTAERMTLISLARQGRFAEVPERLMPKFLHRDRQQDAALTAIVRQMARDVGPEAFIRQQTAIMGRADSRPSLEAIRCPTLVLVGDADALVPAEVAAELANGIRGARLVTVPQCGHLSTLEQPTELTSALTAWLN